MKATPIALLLAGLLGSPLCAAGLDARLTLQEGASEDVRVQVTLTNNGNKPIDLLKWQLPGAGDAPLFVVERDGQSVAYQGALIKRGLPSHRDYQRLSAGESLTLEAEVSGLYDMSAQGEYSISYRLPKVSDKEGAKRNAQPSAKAPPQASESNTVSLWLDGVATDDRVLAKTAAVEPAAAGGSVSFTGRCTNSQKSQIVSALDAAGVMAGDSLSYLAVDKPSGQRYRSWFGAYDASRWNQAEGHFSKVREAIEEKPLTFDCGCKESYFAYVYADQPYKIYLCKSFWTAANTGTDSRGGTIIHELTHFNVVAGTDDLGYGQGNARNLASTDPVKALNNADNHEYFAENTPSEN
ncbi:peptidyl-Lys metalloendopeptidase [Aeromonas sp. BIGb0405]|jgi:peptidyl-Lys metalloendopeptidase|uniref:M35 family metallo-endopeptidase n=1 Tax=Aeromonas sp. BIGb0405 TaxID=2940592 RepID=UPI0021688BC0|nr:M35 family metallo-endopeptidase [Aeromonas sp. BIGb0405]MCS3457615.1 peptidyl-Lys metalloendopeptidase [Aeromonas sp. BIGb0405]